MDGLREMVTKLVAWAVAIGITSIGLLVMAGFVYLSMLRICV